MVIRRIFTVVETKKKGNSGLSSKKMGSRENSFVDEPVPKTAHGVVKESGKLSCNASLRMFMDNFQSRWTFRMGIQAQNL